MDNSKLDNQYFIDKEVFNCPFCNRNNVKYTIDNYFKYNFSNNKEVTVFLLGVVLVTKHPCILHLK
ncbi:MAG: hypothetical protein FH761_17730 [Firmicutes bacterium]|nr:hypothetical protein [Bacillota bacterium]